MIHKRTLPTLALESFPAGQPRRPWYAQRLGRHVAQHPVVSTPHAHTFYLLLFVTQGHGTHTIDLLTYNVRPGSLFFLAPGQVHHWELSADADGYIVFFDADFFLRHYPSGRLYGYPFFDPAHPPVVELNPHDPPLSFLLDQLLQETSTPSPNQSEVIAAYLFLCLELAARHYQPAPGPAPARSVAVVREFSQLLNRQYRTHREVRHYAGQLRLSPNHLNAICRQVADKTASTLIHERVMAEARRLLRHSSQTVGEVAHALGFADAAYFSRFFRKQAGLSPEAYRQQADR